MLSFNELKQYISSVITNAAFFSIFYQDLFVNLSRTGMRVNELHRDNWIITNDNKYILKPLKANDLRTFEANNFTELYRNYLNGIADINLYTSYSSMLRYYNMSIAPHMIMYENKNIGLHVFRHYYIKKLYYDGIPFNEIKSILGYKSSAMLNVYIYSQLYLKY